MLNGVLHMLKAVVVTAGGCTGGGEEISFLVGLHVGYVGGQGGRSCIHLLVVLSVGCEVDRLEAGWGTTWATLGPGGGPVR